MKCYYCDSPYLHRSRLRWYDLPLLLLFLRPYRCEDCERRLYAPMWRRRRA